MSGSGQAAAADQRPQSRDHFQVGEEKWLHGDVGGARDRSICFCRSCFAGELGNDASVPCGCCVVCLVFSCAILAGAVMLILLRFQEWPC